MLGGALSISAQINCHVIRVSSLVTQFVNFDPEMLVCTVLYVLLENDPSFELNNNFVYSQMFGRVVKF